MMFTAIAAVLIYAPPQRHNPFAPIDLTDKPGIATPAQLLRLKGNCEACFLALDEADVAYTPREESPRGDKGCGLFDALTLDQSLPPYSATLQMTCAQSAAVYM